MVQAPDSEVETRPFENTGDCGKGSRLEDLDAGAMDMFQQELWDKKD